jgi:hypothetical protein
MNTKTTEQGAFNAPATDIPAGINPFAAAPVQEPVAAQPAEAIAAPAVEAPATTQEATVADIPAAVIQEKQEEPVIETPAAAAEEAKPTPADIEFANEYSKQLFAYLKEGKTEEVLQYLSEQKTLASVDTMDSEAVIKLSLKYENPDYTDEDIQNEFEERYVRPEKPEQGLSELEDEYEARLAKWEKKNTAYENKLVRAAKQSKKLLAAKKSELVLPDIQQQSAAVKAEAQPTPEQVEAQRKAQEAAVQSYYQSIEKGVGDFNGYTLEVEFDKGVKFPVSFSVDATEKAAFAETLKSFNVNDYFSQRWVGADGTFNGRQYADDVYYLMNREVIAKRMASEGANRRLEEYLKTKGNVDFTGGRPQPVGNMDESDKMAQYFFGAR